MVNKSQSHWQCPGTCLKTSRKIAERWRKSRVSLSIQQRRHVQKSLPRPTGPSSYRNPGETQSVIMFWVTRALNRTLYARKTSASAAKTAGKTGAALERPGNSTYLVLCWRFYWNKSWKPRIGAAWAHRRWPPSWFTDWHKRHRLAPRNLSDRAREIQRYNRFSRHQFIFILKLITLSKHCKWWTFWLGITNIFNLQIISSLVYSSAFC